MGEFEDFLHKPDPKCTVKVQMPGVAKERDEQFLEGINPIFRGAYQPKLLPTGRGTLQQDSRKVGSLLTELHFIAATEEDARFMRDSLEFALRLLRISGDVYYTHGLEEELKVVPFEAT